tara:strand:- start:212 stop:781 length:570 start_codon:yes stop_codon:yes gene_type:complete
MQFLAGIITENVLYEEEPNFSDLSKIDDIIGDELEKAAEEEEAPLNEILGITTVGFVLAIPGIVNGIARIIQSIKSKAPERFNLNQDDDPAPLEYLIQFTDKIDGYLDTPFRIMLKPFVKDPPKRDKIAKFLKATTLMIMALGTDISKSPDILSIGKDLAGEFFEDLISSKNLADLITKAKVVIPQLLK